MGLLTIISKTTPFWTAILGYFFMREAILPIEIGGMLICFSAIIYITVNTNAIEDDTVAVTSADSVMSLELIEKARVSSAGQLLGIILIFISSWLVAGVFVTNKCLKGVNQFTVMFFHGLFGLIMAIFYFGFEILFSDENLFFLSYTANQYSLVILACVFDTCCTYSGLQAA